MFLRKEKLNLLCRWVCLYICINKSGVYQDMNNYFRKKNIIKTYSLFAIDFIVIILSFVLAMLCRFNGNIGNTRYYATIAIFFILAWFVYNILADANRDFFERGYYVEFVAIMKNMVFMLLGAAAMMYVTQYAQEMSRLAYLYFFIFDFIITYITHIAYKQYMLKFYRRGNNSNKVMVISDSTSVESLMNKILKEKDWNYEITSIALVDTDLVGREVNGIPVVARKENLYEVARQMILDEVLIYLPDIDSISLKIMLESLTSMGILCHYNVDTIEIENVQQSVEQFGGFTVISCTLKNMDFRRLMLKRMMDIAGGLVGMLIVIVSFPFVALAIKLESPGPVLFSQIRIGKNGRRFKIYKYRSMYRDAEERKAKLMEKNEMQGLMFKMQNDPRITKVGKIIRKTSIDELPQFWNVLIGDMSLVGTRPPTLEEFEKYNVYYRRRMSITPGLTGMWQVNGRSKVTDFEDVVRYDLQYIDNWSLGLDIKILLQTVMVVLKAKGSE